MAATLIDSWTTLNTEKGVELTNTEQSADYVIFSGISEITKEESVSLEEDTKVNIGIYRIKVTEEGQTKYKYYAFAGTGEIGEANDGNNDDQTLIASGTGTLTGNKITDIEITLQSVEGTEGNPIKKLGFTGDSIVKITGSDGADEAYIIGEKEGQEESTGISSNVVLDFQRGKDTVYSIGATTVSQIPGGGQKGREIYLLSSL